MTVLNFAEISERFANQRRFQDYPIKGFGDVRVRMMPAIVAQPLYSESSRLFDQHGQDPKAWSPEAHREIIRLTAKMIQAGTVDANGEALFPGEEGWKLLTEFDTDTLMEFRDAIHEFNGLKESKEDQKKGN